MTPDECSFIPSTIQCVGCTNVCGMRMNSSSTSNNDHMSRDNSFVPCARRALGLARIRSRFIGWCDVDGRDERACMCCLECVDERASTAPHMQTQPRKVK